MVDEVFSKHLNEAQLDLPVRRLSPGKYLFGTRQISAKLENGILLVRLFADWVNVEDFIDEHGKSEVIKVIQ